ncbi:MAG TPA: hypothetical protein VJL29_10235 [Thermoguttaceae bacterium]|nr:hypothetical protein [Thermoguttaceae bacterium]
MKNALRTMAATTLFTVTVFGAVVFLAGCGGPSADKPHEHAEGTPSHGQASSTGAQAEPGHDHAHAVAGPHGGQLIKLGDEPYQAELVHDAADHKVTVYLLDAEAKRPVASDKTEITLRLFDNGQFVAYTLAAVVGNAGEAGSTQFATTDAKLGEAMHASPNLRGRLDVSIKGKPLTGVVEGHAHAKADHEQADPDHDHDHDQPAQHDEDHDHEAAGHSHDAAEPDHDH